MKRLLLFSDLHLRPESEEVCFKILDDVIQTAKQYNVAGVGFLGDFWHLRYQVPVYLLNRVAQWVEAMGKVAPLSMLPGNHDQIDELGENALEVFSSMGAAVYSKPHVDEWGFWMPYRKDKAVVRESISKMVTSSLFKASTPRILFAHLPIFGARMNNAMNDSEGLNPDGDEFAGFSKVILGHYHKRQSLGASGLVSYVGSPWQTRADEYGQEKGFALWETDSPANYFSYINRKFGKVYHRFEPQDLAGLEYRLSIDKPNKDDVITLVLPTKELLDKATKKLIKAGYTHVLGNATDLTLPQPRYAFNKATALVEYAKVYAKDQGKDVASFEELMDVWGEIAK